MVFKIIQVVFLASVKYLLTIPYALIIGMGYSQTILFVMVGGVAGFLFFYYASKHVIQGYNRVKPVLCRLIPRAVQARYGIARRNRKAVNVTRKSRFIVKLRRDYGLWGIVITTPVLLSIPFGAFLANKYYARRKNVVLYMILSIIGWGAGLGALLQIFPSVVK